MIEKPKLYIIYVGKVDPSDTADAAILTTLPGETTPEQLKDVTNFYSFPHTIMQYEISGGQLINGRIYEKEETN